MVSYLDFTNLDLKVLHCGDANCTSGNVITSPDTAGNVGWSTSLALDADGNPVVSYLDVTNFDLKLLHCGNPNCSSASPSKGGQGRLSPQGDSILTPDTGGLVGDYTSLELDGSGNPVISYYDQTNDDLKVAYCNDPLCSGPNVITAPDTTSQVGWHTSLMLQDGGVPVISYFDKTNGDLKVLRCGECGGKADPIALFWGDVDCSEDIEPITPPNPVDSLKALRFDGGLSVSQAADCPKIGLTVTVDGLLLPWGDVDCGTFIGAERTPLSVTPVDSLKLLRFDAGLSVSQAAGCPEIDSVVTVVQ